MLLSAFRHDGEGLFSLDPSQPEWSGLMSVFCETVKERIPRPTWEFPASSWTSGATFLFLLSLNHYCHLIGFNVIHLEKDAEDNGQFCLGTTKEKQPQINVLKGHGPGYFCKLSCTSSGVIQSSMGLLNRCVEISLQKGEAWRFPSDNLLYVEDAPFSLGDTTFGPLQGQSELLMLGYIQRQHPRRGVADERS